MQPGNVIHDIEIVPWAEVSRRLGTATGAGAEIGDGDERKSLQLRVRHARVEPVTGDGRLKVAGLRIAKVVIPTEAHIVHPGGVRGPGPTGGEELGAHRPDAIKLRQRVLPVIAAGRVASTVEVASSERV